MKIKADGREYPFPEAMTMGELRVLKRHFDCPRPTELDPKNIDHLAGMLAVAMLRQNPRQPIEAVIDRIDAVRTVDFVVEEGDDDEASADPTPAAPAADDATASGN